SQSTVSRIESGRTMGLERSLTVLHALQAPLPTGPNGHPYPPTAPAHGHNGSARNGAPTARPFSRPVGLRPHIEAAFAAEQVTIDFAG
ncbi:hypothetical protein ACFHWE_23835, partial [Nocardiopsis sp. LOL_012]